MKIEVGKQYYHIGSEENCTVTGKDPLESHKWWVIFDRTSGDNEVLVFEVDLNEVK